MTKMIKRPMTISQCIFVLQLPPSSGLLARTLSLDTGDTKVGLGGNTSMPQPIGKGRSFSVSNRNELENFYPGSYGRAPGSEREDLVKMPLISMCPWFGNSIRFKHCLVGRIR